MLSACYTDSFLSDFCLGRHRLCIASRQSNLAKAQVYEFVRLLQAWYPRLRYQIYTVRTRGDEDKRTPLHTVENSDFFSDTVEELVLRGTCHLAVHSAKDLPTAPRTKIVATTHGRDPADLLVYGERYQWTLFPSQPVLGSSSSRRNAILRSLFPQGRICTIRGTIEERLHKLESGEYDAIVVAKAAIQRLHLSPPYTQTLPPPHHHLQGRLSITAATNIASWKKFLSYLHYPAPSPKGGGGGVTPLSPLFLCTLGKKTTINKHLKLSML